MANLAGTVHSRLNVGKKQNPFWSDQKMKLIFSAKMGESEGSESSVSTVLSKEQKNLSPKLLLFKNITKLFVQGLKSSLHCRVNSEASVPLRLLMLLSYKELVTSQSF